MAKKVTKSITPYRSLENLNLIDRQSNAIIQTRAFGVVSGKSYDDNYVVKIRDCHNGITLHGRLRTPNSRKNAIHKLTTIIDEVTKLRTHIENELKINNLRIEK